MGVKRSKKHAQKVPAPNMQCIPCKDGKCHLCVDVLLVIAQRDPICTCTRKGHSGEPNEQQMEDPFTGTVHAPGLAVTQDGKVEPLEEDNYEGWHAGRIIPYSQKNEISDRWYPNE